MISSPEQKRLEVETQRAKRLQSWAITVVFLSMITLIGGLYVGTNAYQRLASEGRQEREQLRSEIATATGLVMEAEARLKTLDPAVLDQIMGAMHEIDTRSISNQRGLQVMVGKLPRM